jgi:hypothetical protein
MFGDSERDLAAWLTAAGRESIERAHFNQHQGQQDLAIMISNERRFDAYDPAKVADQYFRARTSGAVIDLTDSSLARGAAPAFNPLRGGSRSAY